MKMILLSSLLNLNGGDVTLEYKLLLNSFPIDTSTEDQETLLKPKKMSSLNLDTRPMSFVGNSKVNNHLLNLPAGLKAKSSSPRIPRSSSNGNLGIAQTSKKPVIILKKVKK